MTYPKMYVLSSWGTKERTQGSVVISLWFVGAVMLLYWPGGIFKDKCGSGKGRDKIDVLDFKFFERQLHVLFIVIVVQIVTPVMHRQKVNKTDVFVDGLVLGIVAD